MKKFVFSLGLVLISFVSAFAQQMEQLPIDPKLRMGKLENGVTYYIRHNELPKERADFYIAQKVGSILEEDNQNGLAHFLEHMAFNGSTHFPGNRVSDYLETIGVKFGVNLNAYTSYDQTVYNISNVPTLTSGAIDSCLFILHDWSGSLLLDEGEIDKERGVIREEMRLYGGADWRMNEKLSPQVMPGSQYAKRNVIGTEDIIMNFKPETIRAFYKKWYRPDQQGIIIIGDVDVDAIESKLKQVFADIPAPINPAERVYYSVEDNKEPLVGIASDKEATRTLVSINIKHDPLPLELRGTIAGFMTNYFNSIISSIMNERFQELLQKPNPPFVVGAVYNSEFMQVATKDALIGIAIVKDNDTEDALKTLSREIERLNKYGFTAAEYERAKSNIITQYENMYNEREKTQNDRYAQEYVHHFTRGSYIPGIETEYNLMNAIAPQVPLQALNQYVQELVGDENIVITLTAPEKEDVILPTKENLLTWFNEAKSEDIKALEETVSNEPLLAELPKGGKIVKESEDKIFGTTNFELSNGIKVIIKPTKLKDDEIQMRSFSPGGSSHFPETEATNIKVYGSASTLGGLGNFKATELTKVLAGKRANANPYVNLQNEGINGSSNIKDFETMLQLVYLNFTAPGTDEDAFQSFMARIKSQLESQEADPSIALVDTFIKSVYQNTIRNSRLKTTDLQQVNYQKIMDWRKDRYADAGDFTFIFVGNIDPEASKELIAQYLGSLPTKNRKEEALPVNMNLNGGAITNHFNQKMENPKTTVVDMYHTTLTPTLENKIKMDMLQQILNIVYMEKVREDEGGTYGVGVSGVISDYPKGQTILQISFDTEDVKASHLNEIVHKEFKNIAADGPRLEDFNKVKEYMVKRYNEQLEENGYWASVINEYYRIGYNGYTDYLKTVESTTQKDIQEVAKTLLNSGNSIEIVMTGVK